ncbi:MAG: NAD(P)/FAD-dependent oxidoreductase [Deltaproteobacteria bacterium]|nr:NAD(P)/FAD-dependent oxidoreductase [Deltaproteobacteria bacterium]
MRPAVPREVDVMVVGAGPAGSRAALEAARGGARTLLVERKERIGVPVRCGEYVPRLLLMEVDAESGWVEQETTHLVLHMPEGGEVRMRAPGAVLDRSRFDPALARSARDAGATVLTGRTFTGFDASGDPVIDGSAVRARVVIGADGPTSRVARAAGIDRPELMLAAQHVVRLARPMASAHIHFSATLRHGYGWLFPKGGTANMGVAVQWRRPDLVRRGIAELTRKLEAEGIVAAGGPLSRCWGIVPSGGPPARTSAGSVLLAGDAAGQVDPLTGAGLTGALRCGKLAGRAALAAKPATDYEERWREVMHGFYARSLERRERMRALWDTDLEEGVRRAWMR